MHFSLHTLQVAALAMNANGTLLATASTKGTIIRVFLISPAAPAFGRALSTHTLSLSQAHLHSLFSIYLLFFYLSHSIYSLSISLLPLPLPLPHS
jgi:hypothetical protein